MKKLILLLFFCSITLVNAQEKLTMNESTKKYEMNYELDFTGQSQKNLFMELGEWLAVNYSGEGSNLKFSDEKKGMIIFNGAMIKRATGADVLLTFTMTFHVSEDKISCNITNFLAEPRAVLVRQRKYEYEKIRTKKIFKFTEVEINAAINNLIIAVKK
jgi:hypothetical protein